VSLDSANRSFLAGAALGVLFGAFVLCGALGAVLVPLVRSRVTHDGLAGLTHDGVAVAALLVFVVAVAVGLALAMRALVRQALASRRLARRVRRLTRALPQRLARATARTGLEGRVVLLDLPEPCSFVFGAWSPRVAVSRRLLADLCDGELRAVLEHERYHVRNLDPLKLVLLRTLGAALFVLPALESLRARHVAARELAADRRAVAACGRRALAGALLKVVRGPAWHELEVAAPIGGAELLDVRVVQLEAGAEPSLGALGVTPVALSRSLAGVAALLAMFLASVWGFGGPAAVQRATGTGLASATLLGSLACTAPFVGAGLLAYLAIALRARRPLGTSRRARPAVES
jgi:Zn-dependent protease with chaperone function